MRDPSDEPTTDGRRGRADGGEGGDGGSRRPSHLGPGSLLGPYEIVRLLGAGGMGEVYEAVDARIDRRVAVKILPPASDADRLRRFRQEARAAGALSHPNILALYDIGEDDGVHYLVTELLVGESLRERLGRGPVPPRQALEIARQIAEGLAAAHERGIVHRDLKPENLFLSEDGRVKILDFGLAKLRELEGDSAWASRSGLLVGTAAYMAPEQIEGESADGRTDVFALGAILYELLTGDSAFRRSSVVATLHAVTRHEPEHLVRLEGSIPPSLLEVVAGCLEKDPARRFQSARDLVLVLRSLGAAASLPPTEPALRRPPRRRRPSRRMLLGTVAVLGALALTFFAGSSWRGENPVSAPPPRIEHLTLSVNDSSPALAPDGRSVVFVSRRDGRPRIWVKELAGGGESPLTAGPDLHPRFSPDGSTLLFVRFDGDVGALTKMPFPGGEARTLLRNVVDADWSPDGEEIAYVRHDDVASAAGTVVGILAPSAGTTRELARIEGSYLYQPRWSPDGRRIVLVELGGERLVIVDVADGTRHDPTPPAPFRSLSTAAWDGPEHLLVLEAARDLPGVALSAGECLRVGVDDGRVETLFWTPNWGQHLDADGETVVFSAGFSSQSLWEGTFGPDGTLAEGRWLTEGSAIDRQPVYSPDGRWVAFTSDRTGSLDLWKIAVDTGTLARLTDDPATDWDPAFTAAGDLVWASDRGGRFQIWTAASDGSAARPVSGDEVVASDPRPVGDTGWIVFQSSSLEPAGLWRVRASGSAPELVRAGAIAVPATSPSGRHLAYLEYPGPDPRVGSLRVVEWPGGSELLRIDPAPQSLTDLALPGRSGFRGEERIAYLDDVEGGGLGIVHRTVDDSDPEPRRLDLPGLPLRPETFAFSPDGRRVTISHLDLQQHLLIVDRGPVADRPGASHQQPRARRKATSWPTW